MSPSTASSTPTAQGVVGRFAIAALVPEMISLLYIVGFEFVEMYQKLITPPGGKERKSIRQQVMAIVDGAVEADI